MAFVLLFLVVAVPWLDPGTGAEAGSRAPGQPAGGQADSTASGQAVTDSSALSGPASSLGFVDSLIAIPDSVAGPAGSILPADSLRPPVLPVTGASAGTAPAASSGTGTADSLRAGRPAGSQPAVPDSTRLAEAASGIPRSGGLWARRVDLVPSREALLYRAASRRLWAETIRTRQFLKPEMQIREDSMGVRVLPPNLRLRIPDPVTQQVSVREDSTIEISRTARDAPVEPTVHMSRDEYLSRLSGTQFRQIWTEEVNRSLKDLASSGTRRKGLLKIDLPVELPPQLQTVFGAGKPDLSWRGSEKISFGGTSLWHPNRQSTEFARRESKFPQLEMKQDLNFSLTGTIGDKVTVDLDQASQTTTPLANKIKIRYKGYDDEIVQKVDLGNTSLSLPGTQYATYSGSVQGLFGINTQAKLGDLDITSILSKQEGKNESKSVSRRAETKTVRIDDMDYVGNKYFFLRDPDDCPWQLDENSLTVFMDDQVGGNDAEQGARPGRATPAGAGSDTVYTGSFYRLQPGPPPDGQYIIQQDIYTGQPMLILSSPLDQGEVLAVAYRGSLLNSMLQPDYGHPLQAGDVTGDSLALKMIRPSPSDPSVNSRNRRRGIWGPTSRLELRNIYDLGARGILKDGFELRIRLKSSSGGVVEPDRINNTTFLQMLALDLSRETDTGYSPGRDDRIDPEFISYENGLLHFPDLRPFDPDSADLALTLPDCAPRYARYAPGLPANPGDPVNSTQRNYDNQRAYRPRVLPIAADSVQIYRAPAVYDSVITRDTNSRYYLEITYRSPVSKIDLGAFGILPGSETVIAGARTLLKDRDYTIDYDIGEVEILEAAGVTESEEVRVTYSYLPFGMMGGQKTLAGTAASYRPENSNLNLSTAWLFESKGGVAGAEGRRPRLGQEPSRTLVGELAGTWKTDSRLLTRLIDNIPGVDARAPTKLNVGFGAGLSVPNPNTKDALYIDDFDGAREVTSLNMNRRAWRPTSIPGADLDTTAVRDSAEAHGELWWYSPRNLVKERDLQPTLDPREADNSRTVLRMHFFPRGQTPDDRRKSWAGLVQPISTRGQDLSRAQFLDVWVNDFIRYDDPLRHRHGKLHIDIGTVSEDAMWYKNDPRAPADQWRVVRPNGRLDTEDQNHDGKLDQSTTLNEDTGLDNVRSGQSGADPNDVYHFDDLKSESDGGKYANVNGTENNQDLDTEDLNGNDHLEVLNSYFEIAVDLGDPKLWETDVWRDYPDAAVKAHLAADNGWRRIRIPLRSDSLVKAVKDFMAGDPVWEKVFHARVWLSGFEDTTRIDIGSIDITGNRWFENPISDLRGRALPDSGLAPGEGFFVGVLNNKEDAAIYAPPVSVRKSNNVRETEQSITLNMAEFQPGHQASIYRTYPQRQDYTLYENMQFYLNRRFEAGSTDLACGVRLCRDAASDTTNYYEFQRPVPAGWELVNLDFAALSRLQLVRPDSLTGIVSRDLGDGVRMMRKGSPSLTSIQRIEFLVYNRGSFPLEKGSVWIDELRLTSVKKDIGLATRFSMDADMAGLARLNFSYQRTGADFLKVGQDRGSGTTGTNWGFAGSTENLFGFSDRLGINAPIRSSFNYARSVPKFRPNSDLTLDRPEPDDITLAQSQELSMSLQRKASKRWWSRYLIEPFSVNGAVRRSINLQPTDKDTTVAANGSAAWNFPLEQWGDIGLGKSTKLRLIPTNLSASLSGSKGQSRRYHRNDIAGLYEPQPSQDRTASGLGLSAAARPISQVTYRIDSTRDLMIREGQPKVVGLNMGMETSRRHSLTASTEVPLLRRILSPRVSWSGNSNLTLGTQAAGIEGEPDRQNAFGNTRTTNYTARLSLPDLFRSIGAVGKGGAKKDSTGKPIPPPSPSPSGTFGSGLFSIGQITINYGINTQTSFARRTGEPSLFYQLALVNDPGPGSRILSRATSTQANTKTLDLDTSIRLPRAVNVTTRYSRTSGATASNGLSTMSSTRKWPDLDINWGQMQNLIGIGKWFQSFQASTHYTREERKQGALLLPQITSTSSYAPLLNVNATFKSGLSATLSSSFSTSSDKTGTGGGAYDSQNDSDRRQVQLTFKKTVSLTRKITMPVTKEVKTVQTRVDLNGGIDYRLDRRQTRRIGQTPLVIDDRSAFKISAGMGYQFSQRINGTGSLDYGKNTDRKNSANSSNEIGMVLTVSFSLN